MSAPAPSSSPPTTTTRALVPVALLFGSFGVTTAVAILLFALLFDPVAQASSSGFHALGLALGSVAAGCVVGVTVLTVATWRSRHRLGLGSTSAVGGTVLALTFFGLIAVALLHLAGYGILGGVIGTGQRRVDILVRAAAAALCLLVAPVGVGLAWGRRTRAVGVTLAALVLAASVASVVLVRADAADATRRAASALPYVLPPEVTSDVVEGAQGSVVARSVWTVDEVHQLEVPLGAASAAEIPGGVPVDEDTRYYTDFAIMLSDFPTCGEWRDEVRCERLGEDIVVELADGPVIAVRPDPDGGAYGVMLTDPGSSPDGDDAAQRAHDLVDDLRRVTQEEFEDALGITVD